jgi:hypothetical protein
VRLPASDDVGTLSTLIRELKSEAEKVPRLNIKSASACVPHLPGIYDEDLYDSFEFAGMEFIQLFSTSYHGRLLVYESPAALAGHELSVCPNIEQPQKCWTDDTLVDNYYVVDYTKSSLFAYHTGTSRVGVYHTYDTVVFDLDLGLDARHNSADEEYYWEEVPKVPLKPLLEISHRPPSIIILVGDCSNDATFRNVLDGILKSWFKDNVPRIIDTDPVYTQAKGVAELVRRSVYLPKPRKPECVYPTSMRFWQEDIRSQTPIK